MRRPNRTNARRGADAERRTRAAFEADGYVVVKSGGSRGLGDLWAAKPGQLVLIQCKSGEATLSGAEWNDLYRLAQWLAAVPVVADWPLPEGRKIGATLRLRKITGPHRDRSRYWPCRDFLLDEVAGRRPEL